MPPANRLSVAPPSVTGVTVLDPRHPAASPGRQLSFDELETPLSQTTFVVVDLETTGGRPGEDAITEIGAVKVRGGEVLGELATLIDPERSIPRHIVELTGIDDAMVVRAPRIASVLPSFLEFARGAVLVAHNAPFDMGFLKAAAGACGVPWPKVRVLCTVKLARRVLGRDEAPSVRLSALAELFCVQTRPTHRALDDARATVDVLHRLLERVGNQGVHSYSELVDYLPSITAAQRGKRHLAQDLPHRPGVYLFRGPSDEVLYVGTAVDLRRRVRGYFTGSETRGRMKEMVALATRVDHVVCAHGLEAEVRELRLIAAHTPPYNRRSKYPRRVWWLVLTKEAFPRLSCTRTPDTDALGPFRSRRTAAELAETVARACGLRTCTDRLPARGTHGAQCAEDPLTPCPAASVVPEDAEHYAARVDRVRSLIHGFDDAPLHRLREGIEALGQRELFENAARQRDRAAELIGALHRAQRLRSLAALDEMVAARPDGDGGWQFAVVRAGRLAASGVAVRGVPPMPVVDALTASAETALPDPGPLRGALAEEVGLIARWLEAGPARLVRVSSGYGEPGHGAGSWTRWCERAQAGRTP
ncbi:DEDD exonuclease domain-containing protein [Rhodococcus sp. D2-41]|uniref:DEDD exonuclease domain-containing protein n=1 Tax=Speluncibacter jeojiensis TaxID=2710754 RepID=UPI0024108A7E|nr:DEDD exonuclease domain-containing protein [Rhodococcus sp. D2-41]MDG3011949.1 DEDD exonuclease domain-containing protein [Rhodococcus sp. D2-41]